MIRAAPGPAVDQSGRDCADFSLMKGGYRHTGRLSGAMLVPDHPFES